MKTWSIEARRFVGFFDIIGFRALVGSAPASTVYVVMKAFRKAALDAERSTRSLAQGSAPDHVEYRPHGHGNLLYIVQFSDSVVIFTRDDSDPCSLAIVMASTKIFLEALNAGVQVRGAWSRGTCVVDAPKSIFFGQPVVDAYDLAEDQQWFGVVQHESATLKGSRSLRELSGDEIALCDSYEVPLKSGRRSLVALNWPIWAKSIASIEAALAPVRSGRDAKLEGYYSNTIKFAAHVHKLYARGSRS